MYSKRQLLWEGRDLLRGWELHWQRELFELSGGLRTVLYAKLSDAVRAERRLRRDMFFKRRRRAGSA